jgi:uncharacterized membrane protein
MEKSNGRIQEVSRRSKKQALDLGSSNSYRGAWYPWLILACTLSIAGCSLPKIKTALMTGAATTAAVGVTSAVMPAAIVLPAVIGGVTAATVSAVTAERSGSVEPVSVIADTVVQKAPDNLFTMLGNLISVGGIGLIIFLAATYFIPLVMGYLIPNGFERKKKLKK